MYPCSYCSHRANKRYDMKNHMNRHTGKFRCDVCDVNLSRLQSLNNHNTTVDHKKKLNEQMRMSPQPTFDQPDSNKGDVIEQLFTENVSVDGQDFPMDLLLGSSPVKNDNDDEFINSTVGAPSFKDA